MIVEKYLTTKQIKGFLYKYIPKNKEEKKGLFLLPSQTGSGKTHATIQYISERISDSSKDIIIYVVHTKHNVKEAYDKLIENLDERQQDKVILLKNNYEAILDAFVNNASVLNELKYLPEIEEYKALKSSVEIVLKHKDLRYKDATKKAIEMDNNALKNALIKIYKTNSFDNKNSYYDADDFMQEVFLFYPTVMLNKFNAIFMTTHKLFYPIFRLQDSKPLYTSKDFKFSTIFIDEFDAQKKQILDLIISSRTNSTYEFLDLFLRIGDTLRSKKFSKKYNIKQDTIKAIALFFDKTFKKYNMEYGFKYNFSSNSDNETILMDSTLSSIIQGQEKTSKINTSLDDETNYIETDGDKSFSGLLRDIHNGLKMFIGLSRSLAREEVQAIKLKNKESMIVVENEQDTLDRIANDLIKELGYRSSDEHYQYLSDIIKYNVFEKQKSFKSNRDELYEDGFKLIDINQKSKYSKTNNFEFLQLSNTPEKFMKDLCNHIYVVGISATATIPTLMRNFDLEYLKSKVSYSTLDSEEILEMDELYIEAKNQRDRDIHVEYIEPDDNLTNVKQEYFGKDMELDFLEYLQELRHTKKDYYFKQYIRLVHVYREFLIHNEIESLIYLQANFFKVEEEVVHLIFKMMISNKEMFSIKIQNNILDLEQRKKDLTDKEFVQQVIDRNILFYRYDSAAGNKQAYTDMLNRKLEAGKKIFIISSYQTMGVGVNMEYENNIDSELKDIDAIFMDLPTGFTTRKFDNKKGKEDHIRALYELESLKNDGYFTSSEYYKFAKTILASKTIMPYNKTTDYYNSVMSTIIQAVGRLYRTDGDISKMFLYLNGSIAESVVNFNSANQSLLPAIHKLIETTKNHYIKTEDSDENIKKIVNKFNAKNEQLHRKIYYMLQVFNSIDVDAYIIKEWEGYRRYLISNPTVSNGYTEYNFCYEKLPDKYKENKFYYYMQKEDYREVEVSFVSSNNKLEVSEETAMLDVIKKTKELAECVEKYSICLEFKYDYMMTPIAFNNLYKGAMGEVLGRFLIQKFCEIDLYSFDVNNGDEYERFDYKTKDENIYFDFKYYSQSTLERTTQKSLIDKANKKLSSMGANKAIIINIFAQIPDDKSRGYTIDDNVVIIPYLIDITDRNNPTLDYKMLKAIKSMHDEK